MIKRVCVFCASSDKIDKRYIDEAYSLGRKLAGSGLEIIYGGGKKGLMGALSSGALSADGRVIGVIPEFMDSLELGRKDIFELRTVKNMHQRVEMLIKDSDMLIALPGGVGTYDELMQAVAWKTLGLIIKPIIIFNTNNFFEHIIKALEYAEDQGFMHVGNKLLWKSFSLEDEILTFIENYNSKLKNIFNFNIGEQW